jgi:FG-GAP repeat
MPSNEKAFSRCWALVLPILFAAPGAAWVAPPVAAPLVTPQAVLSPPDPTSLFGWVTAVSGDGRTAVVGTADSNQAYIFVQSGGVWALDAELSGLDGFGDQVAISADGAVALVANIQEHCITSPSCGAVYAFARKNGAWIQEAHLTPASAFDFEFGFGTGLAISADGSTALVGRPSAQCNPQPCRGAVYVYGRDAGGIWSLSATLTSPFPSADAFGGSVALSYDGNTALVGTPGANCPASEGCGKTYAFVRSGGIWSQQAELVASDPYPQAGFGSSVGLSADGTIALVGAPENQGDFGTVAGAVYEFVRDGGSWTERQKITGGGSGDWFGSSLSLSGDGRAALVGAPATDCAAGDSCGAVYSIVRQGVGWSSPQTLVDFPGSTLGGHSVAISGNGTIGLAGAPGVPGEPCGPAGCGMVYVFVLGTAIPAIPTASGLGLLLLTLLLAASGARVLSRHRRSA